MPGIPTAGDINVYDSLDERSAIASFRGKSLDEAEQRFRDNFLYYQEDLFAMGPRAFNFYVLAAIAYLLSPEATGDADGVNCFCGGFEHRLNHEPQLLGVDCFTGRDARSEVREAIELIVRDFDRFDVDESIYGDVRSRYKTLLKRLVD